MLAFPVLLVVCVRVSYTPKSTDVGRSMPHELVSQRTHSVSDFVALKDRAVEAGAVQLG